MVEEMTRRDAHEARYALTCDYRVFRFRLT
jgi:hypothetical protein